MTDMSSLKPEQIFLYDGLQSYAPEAIQFCKEYNDELESLMNQYGIDNEGDIACGCLNTVSQNHPIKNLRIEELRSLSYEVTNYYMSHFKNGSQYLSNNVAILGKVEYRERQKEEL